MSPFLATSSVPAVFAISNLASAPSTCGGAGLRGARLFATGVVDFAVHVRLLPLVSVTDDVIRQRHGV